MGDASTSGSKRKQEEITQPGSVLALDLIQFPYDVLKSATGNFEPRRIIRKGSSGGVYRAWMNFTATPASSAGPGTGSEIAIKRPQSIFLHERFEEEMNFLGKHRHPNLVRLIGYAAEAPGKALIVYQSMNYGSLRDCLVRSTLPWTIRMQIAIGIAEGLRFMHALDPPVIWRDANSGNVFLDEDFTPKINDYGWPSDVRGGDVIHIKKHYANTPLIAAPETRQPNSSLTTKSDVYSFGVILLELLTGKVSYYSELNLGELHFVERTKPHLRGTRELKGIMDAKLVGKYPDIAALDVAGIAWECLQDDAGARPIMSGICSELELIIKMNTN